MQEDNKVEKMLDYFSFEYKDEGEDSGLVEVKVTEKGQKFLNAKKEKDSKFNEEEYFGKIIRQALEAYIAKNKYEENQTDDE